MADFFRVLYVDPAVAAGPSPLRDDMALLRSWLWEQSAHVRWRSAGRDDLADALGTPLQVALLDWPESVMDAANACACLQAIRNRCPEVPVFVVLRNAIRSPFPEELAGDPMVWVLGQGSFSSRKAIKKTWRDEVKLPTPPVKLQILSSRDLAVNLFLDAVGDEPLKLTVQKFLPDASQAEIYSVGGGWSGTKICRIFVDRQEELFYVKLFDELEVYQKELLGHAGAQQWLGPAVVELVPVPQLGPETGNQFEAFPQRAHATYAICYHSASTVRFPRYTQEETYRRASGPELVLQSLEPLIAALATQNNIVVGSEMPWASSGTGDFLFDEAFRSKILAALARLRLYGGALPGGWAAVEDTIGQLVYCPLPPWLNGQPCSFHRGCLHGDPNCRNCLVASDSPVNLRLIDCGGFRPDGRLASDLAIIERDVKLLLLGTEPEAAPWFDLDIRELPVWCDAETQSIQNGLGYSVPPTAGPSVARAYRLVELVRQRAKELCVPGDPEGREYFSMLLYWTLEALLHDAVRPTKKLLALFSGAQILRRFR